MLLVCLLADRELQILKRTEGDPRKEHPKKPPLSESEGSASPSNSSEFLPPLPDNSKNIIPVYCSILAAVVVGLLAYVAFKCWNTCKQKKQLAKARAGELGASPEGEKLHSDSGVFLDTHSLQDLEPPLAPQTPHPHPRACTLSCSPHPVPHSILLPQPGESE
uniref:Tumor necrosis factor receptor member 16 transmembrane domain-containing protein n=1 Tax=Chelonoidis abingdonii TaxID=106734 RepID=A0A8C0QRF9_CHEAB